MERFVLLCPLFGVSFIRGSTVYTAGEPPARPVALENSGATESSMTVPLTAALSRDVHSMDVRTMAALQRYLMFLQELWIFLIYILYRIRELGNLLTEENKGMVKL